MTVDGTIVPADSVYLNKSQDYDGKPCLRFEYTTRARNVSGLEEVHGYFLPPPDDTAASATANEHGLVQHQVVDTAKAVADIQAYFAPAKAMKDQVPDEARGDARDATPDETAQERHAGHDGRQLLKAPQTGRKLPKTPLPFVYKQGGEERAINIGAGEIECSGSLRGLLRPA